MSADRGEIGPKAESLERLAAAELPVPDARFLDSAAFAEHTSRCGLAAVAAASPFTPAAARASIRSGTVSDDVAELLRAWHAELGGGEVAVRSSGTAEDLPHASFAGQHGTYFASSADEVIDRVRDCWASLFSDRAVRYREQHGIPHADVAMAVIVQRLVPAVAAGVAFTADPVTGSPDAVIVEACLGIGETLVSGKVTPDRFTVAREPLEVLSAEAGDKRVRLVKTAAGAVAEEAVDAADAARLCISQETAREVARLALEAERVIGGPADVEWAFDGEKVWLLQARPVTSAPAAAGLAASAPAGPVPADAEPVIWSNVNTGEILPDVASPMTWTIIHDHADDVFGGMFGALGVRLDAQKLIGLVGGRIYFNLSMLRESFAHFPGMDTDTVLGGLHDFVELPPLAPVRGRPHVLALARAALAMPAYIVGHRPSRAGRFAGGMRRETERALREAASGPDPDGAYRLVRHLLEQFDEFDDGLAFMAVAMFGFGILTALTKRWLGDDSGALANRMVAGAGDVASAEAGHALWHLSVVARDEAAARSAVLLGVGWADVRSRLEAAAGLGDAGARRFLAEWDAFMREHGHHRRGELEFANPTWAETPDYVLGIIRGYLVEHASSDPAGAYAERAAGAARAEAEALAKVGGIKRAILGRVVGWGRASARTRENVKSEAVRWLVAIRMALLALGARLAAGTIESADDVFYLEYGELDAAVADAAAPEGARDWKAVVATRRAEHDRLVKLSPPPVVVGEWDEKSSWGESAGAVRTLRGITVSAGVVRGRARVFLTSGTDEPVLPGEILVAPFTDPGWTPYFVPAAGIVMDMGGLLSHGSIIAREYGIPAVVNVGPATRIIRTGDLIEVDGEKGEVRILR